MPCGRPLKGREKHIQIKPKTTTHLSWTTKKKSLGMKSDDELVCYFLEVLDGQSIDQQVPIITSSILSPEVPPNSDTLFSTPVREATVLMQQRSLQTVEVSPLTQNFSANRCI